MRIAFDVRPFLKEESGVGVYFKNLLHSLARADSRNEYFLLSSSFKDRFQPEKIPAFTRMVFRDLRIPAKCINFMWYTLKWPPLDSIFRKRLDLTHSATPLILPTKGKKIITVYDLFFLNFPSLADKEARTYFTRNLRSSLKRSNGIISISHFIKAQLLEKYSLPEKKVRVIYLGVDDRMKTPLPKIQKEQVKKRFSLPASFLLFVGTIEPRKNLLSLIEALRIIKNSRKKNVFLVIAGRQGSETSNLISRIKEAGLQSHVRLTGYISDMEKQALYQLARLLVVPSLCEGFGLPLVEAMTCGLPAAASRGSALSEIGQDAVAYFDPNDPADMASSILRVLENSALRKNLVEKGKKRAEEFSWGQTAEQTLQFYQDVQEDKVR